MDLTEVSDELKEIEKRRALERRLRECLASMERETVLRGTTKESVAKYIIIEYLNHIPILGKQLSDFEDLRVDVMEVYKSYPYFKTVQIDIVLRKIFGDHLIDHHRRENYICQSPESYHIGFLLFLMWEDGYSALEEYRRGIEAFSSS